MHSAKTRRLAGLVAVLLACGRVEAQTVIDGSDTALDPETVGMVLALVGRGLKDPSSARYGRLRSGRAGALCGVVDVKNRMGDFAGPRRFVADPVAGFAGIVPDAPELRHPASMADYQAMQRTLTTFNQNCTAD